MKEAISVWAPLYDRAVALFVETLGETNGEPSLIVGVATERGADDADTCR